MTTEDLAARIKELTRAPERKKEMILGPVAWKFVGAGIMKERHLHVRIKKSIYPAKFDGQSNFSGEAQFYPG